MVANDPVFENLLEPLGLTYYFLGIGTRGDMRPIVVDLVSLAATDFEVSSQRGGRCAQAMR